LPHLFEIFIEKDLSLLPVFGLLPLSKNLEDVLLKEIRVRVSYIDQLQSILDCDLISAGQIVHEELHQVKEVARLESSLIKNASLVHEGKFVLVDLSVKVLIDFPNPLINLWLAEGKAEFSQDSDDIFLVDGETAY